MGCLCRKSARPASTDDETKNETCVNREKCKRCGKQLLTFMFSHIGLIGLVIGYSFLGAFIFQKLEEPRELKVKEIVNAIRANYAEKLMGLTFSMNVFDKKQWSTKANKLFQEFQTEVYLCTKELGWNGSDDVNEVQWTFAGSLLYAVTTITTIGYGHIAPKTNYGRIATMVYALIGIPLMLLCLANIAGVMGTCFKFAYNRICCGLCRWHKSQKKTTKKSRKNGNKSRCCRRRKCYSLCCNNNSNHQSRTNPEPAKQSSEFDVSQDDDSGVRIPLQEIESSNNTIPDVVDSSYGNREPEEDIRVIVKQKPSKPPTEERSKQTSEKTAIPLVVIIVIMTLYILGGSLLFTLWEKGWDFLEGTYFCFITLTTIGFGDLVPGVSFHSRATQEKLIICSIYLIFGIALLATCFELMQERVRFICKRIGRCLGFVGTTKNTEDKNIEI